MLARSWGSNLPPVPVAILDKELHNADTFHIEISELCSMCGARFGIGFVGRDAKDMRADEMEELLRKLTEILAKDHRQHRNHKGRIELDL